MDACALINGQRVLLEVKTGRFARLSENQKKAFEKLLGRLAGTNNEQIIPRGRRAEEAGFRVGVDVGPIPFWIVWRP